MKKTPSLAHPAEQARSRVVIYARHRKRNDSGRYSQEFICADSTDKYFASFSNEPTVDVSQRSHSSMGPFRPFQTCCQNKGTQDSCSLVVARRTGRQNWIASISRAHFVSVNRGG
jgi:hypothetical protein